MIENNKHIWYLPIEEIESEHTALMISNKLSSVEKLQSFKVEANNKRIVLEGVDVDMVNDIIHKLEVWGYKVVTVKRSFPVLSMSCASCAASAGKALSSAEGVLQADVNYGTTSAQVTFLPSTTNPHVLKAIIQSVGYDLLIEDDALQQDTLEGINIRKYQKLKRKTIWAVLLATPVMLIGMFFMNMPYANEIMWVLTTPIMFWLGKDFFVNAWRQAKHRSANMDTLVALSTGIAYVYSVLNMLYPYIWHQKGLHTHVYFEAAAVVIAFILLGKLLEERAKDSTSSAIKKLMGLQPKSVVVILPDGSERIVNINAVELGDTILVKPGEKIPLDGNVVLGRSYVDESLLSGEAVPIMKEAGDTVFGGTINQKGSFQFKAQKVGKDTVLAQIIQAVQDAQGSKPPVQKLVNKIAAVFVPTIIGIACLTFLLWVILSPQDGVMYGLLSAVTVLIIACPCALGLATPTAIMVGIGKGAEQGILIKDAESLESANKVNAIILDKTGTITEGKPKVTDSIWIDRNEKYTQVLYAIEKHSEHPLAEAVMQYLGDQQALNLTMFESITGKGVQATYGEDKYYVGNLSFLEDNNIEFADDVMRQTLSWSEQSKTVIFFAVNRKILGAFALADAIKPTSIAAITEMKQMGIQIHMLTGDNTATAKSIAAQTGIEHYRAEMLPQQKAAYVANLQQEGYTVAMVGDGINDSTALAKANVSIAMGRGSDIAMDVAKMVIVSSDLGKIPQAIRLSANTVTTIKQNLFWAFIYNIIGIPLAAGILYPVNGFLLNPMIAGAAMALSSVSVVSNSLRLKWKK